MSEPAAQTNADTEVEVLDGEPVLAPDVVALEPAPPPRLPVRRVAPSAQAVALAAGGFLAGAATIALTRHRRVGSPARRTARTPRRRDAPTAAPAPIIQIITSAPVHIDVHLLHGHQR